MTSLPERNEIRFSQAQKATGAFLKVHWKQLILLLLSLLVLSFAIGILLIPVMGAITFAVLSNKFTPGDYLFSMIGGGIVAYLLFSQIAGTWWMVSFLEYVSNNYRGNHITFWTAIKKGWKILAKSFGTMLVQFLCIAGIFLLAVGFSAILYSFASFAISFTNAGSAETTSMHVTGGMLMMLIVNIVALLLPFLVTWIVSLYFGFTIYAVVAPGKSYFQAISYSISLIKGRWWRILGYQLYYAALSLLAMVVYYILIAVGGDSAGFRILCTFLYYGVLALITVHSMVCISIIFLHFSGQETYYDVQETDAQYSSHFLRISTICILLIALAAGGSYAAAKVITPLWENFSSALMYKHSLNNSGSIFFNDVSRMNNQNTSESGLTLLMGNDGKEDNTEDLGNEMNMNASDTQTVQQENHPNRIYHTQELN